MKLKRRKLLGGFNRFRLMLTLGLAVLLPAATLIYVNFSQLRAIERDKGIEAIFHREFQDVLAITEKNINKKAYTMTEEARELFPSPDTDTQEKEKKLDLILARKPWLSHAFLFDEKGLVFRSQPGLMGDKYFREEHEHMTESYRLWLGKEGKMQVEAIHKRPRGISFSGGQVKRENGDAYLAGAMFALPQTSPDRVVLGGVAFEGCYLKGFLFQEILDEMVSQKSTDQGGNRLAMMIYPADMEMGKEIKPLAISAGWGVFRW